MPLPAKRRRLLRRAAPALLMGGAALAGGLALFVAARARAAEERHPPRGRFLTIDGVRLRYREAGEGDPVVLIHGNGSLIEEFEVSGLFDRLAERHRVIAIDRPGFGYSERPRTHVWTAESQGRLIAGALAALKVADAVVYGHSYGTQVAVELALRAPERVRALVLASGYLYPTARPDVPLFSPPAIPVVGDVLRYTVSPFVAAKLLPRIYRRLFAPAPVPRRFWAEMPHELLLRPSHLRAAAADTALLVLGAHRLESRYRRLSMPVTLLVGEGDRIAFKENHSLRLHEALPSSRLVVVRGAGHMVHHTALDDAVDVIERAARETGWPDSEHAAPPGSSPSRARHKPAQAPA